ncbi:unnamed protein product [Linum tenue]|uniref:Uncharacterized protein n=1 Tax=Linum tenue TaxID=586396 RepID=A0AAV0QMY3_9ROSI|nr:unnamed protein product [Linum tenue]
MPSLVIWAAAQSQGLNLNAPLKGYGLLGKEALGKSN